MSSILNVTELDFDQIKQNLTTYLKTQDGFTDYDFDGSGLSILMDVLAYNTHYNAINAHYTLNEAFLDSAQIRGNVVTRAKSLGYVPRSKKTARAIIDLVITAGATQPDTLTLPRGTKFITTIDNKEYSFVTLSEVTSPKVQDGSAYKYTFTGITIYEGVLKKTQYTVNNLLANQKYQLSDTDVDTTTLDVKVKLNPAADNSDTYTLYKNTAVITASAQVYLLQQNANEYFEIYFGDGVTGRKPVTGNVVTLEYVYGSGADANGAIKFTLASTILEGSTNTIIVPTRAAGGQAAETIESIRFNAPLKFAAQGRAVSADDYRAIIKSEYSNISAIAVWGGENNLTPDYGRVYIAIKPLTGDNLTELQKETVLSVLVGKTVSTVTPVIVDTDLSQIYLPVNVRYNPNLTAKTNNELVSVVAQAITDYGNDKLNDFDGVFRYSKLTQAINEADPAIVSCSARPQMSKQVTFDGTTSGTSTELPAAVYVGDPTKRSITSSSFTWNSIASCRICDISLAGSTTQRNVVVFVTDASGNITVIEKVGVLTMSTGTILWKYSSSISNKTIRIYAIPDSLDIAPKRGQIMNLLAPTVTVEIDTIATSGQAGALNYNTSARNTI